MGTANAILLLAVPNTNWVNATFSWVTTGRSISRVTVKRSVSWVTVKRSTQPDPAPGRFVPSFLRGRIQDRVNAAARQLCDESAAAYEARGRPRQKQSVLHVVSGSGAGALGTEMGRSRTAVRYGRADEAEPGTTLLESGGSVRNSGTAGRGSGSPAVRSEICEARRALDDCHEPAGRAAASRTDVPDAAEPYKPATGNPAAQDPANVRTRLISSFLHPPNSKKADGFTPSALFVFKMCRIALKAGATRVIWKSCANWAAARPFP